MEPFERELRAAFARRDPSIDFTDRLMNRVRSAPREVGTAEIPSDRPRARLWHWVAAGTMAASLLTGAFIRGERSERRAAERAEMELIEALSIAGSKINDARTKVWEASTRGRNQ